MDHGKIIFFSFVFWMFGLLFVSHPQDTFAAGPDAISKGSETQTNSIPPEQNQGMFSPFQTSDWIGFGLTALSDFADMDSSYAMTVHEKSSMWSPAPCPPGSAWNATCTNSPGHGEKNPLILGMFGTHFPTPLEYATFGILELGVQTLISYALPEKFREGAWGIFVGMGVADTVMNSYGGGVSFRF